MKTIKLDRAYWSKVRHRDLYDDPLWPTVGNLVIWNQQSESFEHAQLRAAREMPLGLRYYFLIMSLDGLWGNGGMQAVVLRDDSTGSLELVKGAAEALRFHGSHERARILDDLVSVAEIVVPKLLSAQENNAPGDKIQALWDQIDAFDARYDKADPTVDPYARIVKHAHAHPELYVPPNVT